MHEKKSIQNYTSMHSGGLELTKLTRYTRLEDNLILDRRDRQYPYNAATEHVGVSPARQAFFFFLGGS